MHAHDAATTVSPESNIPVAPRYKQPVSVLVVIHTPALEVLLLERADVAGYWQSVTGSVESDETLSHAAQRELFEETGLRVGIDGVLHDAHQQNIYEIYEHWRHRYPPGTVHNTEHVFTFCMPAIRAITLAPREHLQFTWLPWQAAAAKVFSHSNSLAIKQLQPTSHRYS